MTPRRRKVKGSSPKSKIKKILARWSDGLFYVVKILKVSESKKRCLVEFEDQSTAYVHFKDLLDEHKEDLKTCHNCGGDHELEGNTFIRCSSCDREYHRHCHMPPIISESMAKQFVCRICVFAACAQSGGAKETGPMAARFTFMKQEFPYDIEHLSWNPSHTRNTSESYCYCGGPGNFYDRMLQCCRCQQWFHEACLQCLSGKLLMGDRFYIFSCTHCNHGQEFLQRLELPWDIIMYIAVFHLCMTQSEKYTDLDKHIVPFLKEHIETFNLHQVLGTGHLDTHHLKQKALKVLMAQSDVYCCGATVKKKHSLYGLKERIPPPPPCFHIPHQSEKISALTLSGPPTRQTLFKPPKYPTAVPYLIQGVNKFIPSTMSLKLKEASMARLKCEHNYCSTSEGCKTSMDSPFFEDFDSNNNRSPSHCLSQSNCKIEEEETDSADTDISSDDLRYNLMDTNSPFLPKDEKPSESFASASDKEFWSLDTAIPEPVDFSGVNNPFLTNCELEDLKAQRQHFMELLESLPKHVSSPLKVETAAEDNLVSPTLPVSVAPRVLRSIRGFKGELAKIIQANGCSSESPNKLKNTLHRSVSPDKLTSQSLSAQRDKHTSPRGQSAIDKKADGPDPLNGIKRSISTRRGRNGYKSNHHKEDHEKQKKASRYLKKLTPTCGFHFPVLDENHPSLVNGFHEDSTPPARKGVKRKHSSNRRKGRSRNDSHLTEDTNSENVRRSHRSRQVVKKFEISGMEKIFSHSAHSDQQGNSGVLSEARYNVVSLRVREDDTVDYLIDWFES